MVRQGIVLGHEISRSGIEVDKAKVKVIAKLPPPKSIKDIRFFLGHAWFYRQFIKDFSKIARPLTNLLAKDVPFDFNDECFKSWGKLKQELIFAPIISAPNWAQPFKIMYDASDFAIGAVLGQRIDNRQHMIFYPSRVVNDAQQNYTMTEKEFLVVVFALEKFRPFVRLEDGDFYGSLGSEIPHDQEGSKSPIDSVDHFASRI